MKQIIACIFVLTFSASCVWNVSPEPSGKSIYTSDALTIFITGNELGALKPCGCSGGQLGGLSRRAAVFDSVPKSKRLIIDTGSLVKSQDEQDLIKFNIILQAFRELDYDLVSLSEKDIEMGKNVGLLDDSDSGLNIISPYKDPDISFPAKFTKSLLLKGKTVIVTIEAVDAKSTTIEKVMREYEPGDSGINILILNHCDAGIIDFIAKRAPLIDCIICPSESDEPRVIGRTNKRPLVFSVGRFGRHVCKLQITDTTEGKGKPKLSFLAIPVKEDLKPEDSLVQLYKDYQQLVRQRNLLEKYPRFILPEGLKYTGSESCKACHEYEYAKWSPNAHAHAYATLEREGTQFDPECVICHVVGMKYSSGFISEQKTGHLKNVGCENCHGAGSEHIKTLGKAGFVEPKSSCLDCHTPEQSGDYAGNEASFRKKIVHWRELKANGNVK